MAPLAPPPWLCLCFQCFVNFFLIFLSAFRLFFGSLTQKPTMIQL